MGRGRVGRAPVSSGVPDDTGALPTRPLPIPTLPVMESRGSAALPRDEGVGVQGAKPPGGFQGGALTFLRYARPAPPGHGWDRVGTCVRRRRAGYARSKIAAMPWPPPMHMVTRA